VGAAVGIIFILIIVIVSKAVAAGGPMGYQRLVRNGVPARGILLAVDSYSTKIETAGPKVRRGVLMPRYVRRGVTIDVEIPGEVAYEVTTSVVIPTNLDRDVLPGATVELRVNRSKRKVIAIVGPGAGFAAFRLGASQFDQRAS
jgi:hypothetical protein